MEDCSCPKLSLIVNYFKYNLNNFEIMEEIYLVCIAFR